MRKPAGILRWYHKPFIWAALVKLWWHGRIEVRYTLKDGWLFKMKEKP